MAERQPCRGRVVMSDGKLIQLEPPAGVPAEPAHALRLRVGDALGVDSERVVLFAGATAVPATAMVGDVLSGKVGTELTAVVTEDIMDVDDPQHCPEYAAEIFRKHMYQERRGAVGSLAGSDVLATPDATSHAHGGGASSSSSSPVCPGPGGQGTGAAVSGCRTSSKLPPPQDCDLQTPPKRLRGTALDRTGRCALMDWLVEEHHKFQLRTETLFLAANLVDRFLLRRRVPQRNLKLVGASALLIAAKYEEIYPPELRDLVYITNNLYTVEEVKLMEVVILSELGFSIAGQTIAHFMDWYLRANRSEDLEKRLVRYLLELALLDEVAIQYSASHLAAASVLLANRLSGRLPAWSASMANHTGLQEATLDPCSRALQKLVREVKNSSFQRVRSKLSKDLPLFQLVQAIEVAIPHASLAAESVRGSP